MTRDEQKSSTTPGGGAESAKQAEAEKIKPAPTDKSWIEMEAVRGEDRSDPERR